MKDDVAAGLTALAGGNRIAMRMSRTSEKRTVDVDSMLVGLLVFFGALLNWRESDELPLLPVAVALLALRRSN